MLQLRDNFETVLEAATRNNKSKTNTESKTSIIDIADVTVKESGTYPAIPLSEYRDDLTEELAVHIVRINKNAGRKQPNIKPKETAGWLKNFILCWNSRRSSKKLSQTKIEWNYKNASKTANSSKAS